MSCIQLHLAIILLLAPATVASYADALWTRHTFLPHERLLQRDLTSIHGGGPITGHLPFFGKRVFDPFHFAQADDLTHIKRATQGHLIGPRQKKKHKW